MLPLFTSIGARTVPFLWGWFSNDVTDWWAGLNLGSMSSADKSALGGWGVSTLFALVLLVVGYFLAKKNRWL